MPELDFAFQKTFGPDSWHWFYVVFLSKKDSSESQPGYCTQMGQQNKRP